MCKCKCKCNRRQLTDEEKSRRQIYSKKLNWGLALLIMGLNAIEYIFSLALYTTCLLSAKERASFNTIAFGDCNGPKIFFILVISYLMLQTILSMCAILGFWRREYKFIVPAVIMRGVYVGFVLLSYYLASENLDGWEITFNSVTVATLAFTWCPLMLAFLHIYGETEPVLRDITYDET